MTALESPIEVELVLQPGIEYEVELFADGFRLSGWGEGAFELRGWPLGDAGALTTTDRNVVRLLGSSGCVPGVVEPPPPDRVESVTGDVPMLLRWPCAATAQVDRHQGRARYRVDIGLDAEPVRWLGLGQAEAWAGVSADGHLCAAIVEGQLPERVRVPLHLRAGGWSTALYAGSSFSASEPHDDDIEDDDDQEVLDHEEESSEPYTEHHSDQGNASLSVAGRGSPWLSVDDCRPGDPIAVDPDARPVETVDGWQTWPADVRATSWLDDGRTWVAVRFGDTAVDETVRLGGDTWVGSSATGEIGVIVFGGVRDVPSDGSDLDDFADDPTAMRHLDRLLGSVEALGFDVYGIAGELGAPSGLGTTDGKPSSLPILYGRVQERRWVTVTSGRRGSSSARREVAAELVPPPDFRPDASPEELHAFAKAEHARHRQVVEEILGQEWEPATVAVDGEPLVFDAVRHGERWGGLARIGGTTVTVVAQGREAAEIRLERIADLAPHVDYARRRLREEMERRMPPEARRMFAERLAMPPAEKERRSAVRRVVGSVMGILQRDNGRRGVGRLFTSRVVDAWGGRDRYEELLGLHTMLRPVGGHSTRGDDPTFTDEGTARFRVELSHPLPSPNHAIAFMVTRSSDARDDEPEPEPDREAIRRGESHTITLTLVNEGDGWLIDTDLLAVFIDRLGTFEEVARPMPQA